MTMSNIARYPHCILSNKFLEPEASHQLKDGYLVPYNPTIGPYYPSEKTLEPRHVLLTLLNLSADIKY